MAGKRIEDIENGALCKSMEDMIELWHIRRMLQDDNRLTNWTEEHFLKLKCATDSYDGVVARYFKSMEPDNVEEEYNKFIREFLIFLLIFVTTCMSYTKMFPKMFRLIYQMYSK